MPDFLVSEPAPLPADAEAGAGLPARLTPIAQYAASLALVALATGAAFILEGPIGSRNLTLIYVLPVIAAATGFGWGPSLFATVCSVLTFDFFFTEPKYSLVIASPADVWAAGLLLVIATVVSAVAAASRRRELAAREAAAQAQALQALAHVVIEAGSWPAIAAAAAAALHAIFHAPSVIFMQGQGELRAVSTAGGARITPAEDEAAKWVLSAHLPARAEAYPFQASSFDFWPVGAATERRCVIGVGFTSAGRRRPAEADRFAEIISAYLAAALGRESEDAGAGSTA